MRNRSFWQILCVIFVLASLQRYFMDPGASISMDALLMVPTWLTLLAVLCFTVFALEKLGERARNVVRLLVTNSDSPAPSSRTNWIWVLAGFFSWFVFWFAWNFTARFSSPKTTT